MRAALSTPAQIRTTPFMVFPPLAGVVTGDERWTFRYP
jgi:hypothetical protein